MRTAGVVALENRLLSSAKNTPLTAYLELTYRCPFNCVHCYCKNTSSPKDELSASEWKNLLVRLKRAGCLWITFTGGEAVSRRDFEEIYRTAKELGFLVTVFTTGYPISKAHLDLFRSLPPYTMEISVYGAAPRAYESVTRVPGSFKRAMSNIRALKAQGLNISIKMPCMTANYREFGRVKAWAEKNFGSLRENIYNFSYDCNIYPRLDGDTSPCKYRLYPEQRREMLAQDRDARAEHECAVKSDVVPVGGRKTALYRCNSWRSQLFINPRGRMKFCMFTEKFSRQAGKASLLPAFRAMGRQVARASTCTDSPCGTCHLRGICYSCPAAALLEMGHQETPVPYFCVLAHEAAGGGVPQ
ncbi:MAG: radical SAM protein [Elusimicrobia bacterium]|nr:radical SAM protein [Elusimicrobiota bacterium]